MTGALGLYRPRRTPLHLAPTWLKLVLLAAIVLVTAGQRDLRAALIAAAISAVLLASTLPPPRPTIRIASLFIAFGAVGTLYHWWQGDLQVGLAIGLNITTAVLLSLSLSTATSMDSLMSVFTTMALPLKRWIPPAAIGLSVSLMIRSVPEAVRLFAESRHAARARGLGRSPRATLIPLGLRTVGYALAVGDAISARGLLDERD